MIGALERQAVAIVCVPCRREGRYFSPTDELVLAELSGGQRPHPVVHLAAWAARPDVTELTHHADGLTVIFDDLAAKRSWMLPPGTPTMEHFWPVVKSTTEELFTGCGIDVEIIRFSALLARHGYADGFQRSVNDHITRYKTALAAGTPRTLAALMEQEMAKRRRFTAEHATGHGREQLEALSAAQLGNYAAQGELVAASCPTAYLSWTQHETDLMQATAGHAFNRHVAAWRYDQPPPTAPGDPAAPIPKTCPALKQTLGLYLRDLPATPKSVVAGLVDDIVAGLAKLVTPGLGAMAIRELTALNDILPGGKANHRRAAALLEAAGRCDHPPWRREQLIKKLFCHLASRYSDNDLTSQQARHIEITTDLTTRLPADTPVALALTGSLATADKPDSAWHPYLSDIDVMPLRLHPPDTGTRRLMADLYDAVPRPPWLYLNTGARQGCAGLERDPHDSIFAADQLPHLSQHEFFLLAQLTAPMRFLAGDQDLYQRWRDAFTTEASHRKVTYA